MVLDVEEDWYCAKVVVVEVVNSSWDGVNLSVCMWCCRSALVNKSRC